MNQPVAARALITVNRHVVRRKPRFFFGSGAEEGGVAPETRGRSFPALVVLNLIDRAIELGLGVDRRIERENISMLWKESGKEEGWEKKVRVVPVLRCSTLEFAAIHGFADVSQ